MSDLDKKFQDALADYTSLPNPGHWERFEKALDAEQGAPVMVPVRGGATLRRWMWSAASVAIVATLLWNLPTETSTYTPRTWPTLESEKDVAPSPNQDELPEYGAGDVAAVEVPAAETRAVETPKSGGSSTPSTSTTNRPMRSAPKWEARLEEYELAHSLEAEILPLDAIRSEWIQEPVRVIVEFNEPQYAQVTMPESTTVQRLAGATARTVGTNLAKIVGKGLINWEAARTSVNERWASSSPSKTPKIN